MIKIHKYADLGHANYGWLDARYHFSFANYYNPDRLGFGSLLVINDDIIKAGTGFSSHPHQNMEIITYVRSGAITHKDSNDNNGRTEAGDIQVMSAGTGIFHSEYNLESEDANLYQIWIKPKKIGVKPRWETKKLPKDYITDALPLLVSGKNDANSLFINQDAKVFGGKLKKYTEITHSIENQVYLLVADGILDIDGQIVTKGDGIEVTGQKNIKIKALENSETLIIDTTHE